MAEIEWCESATMASDGDRKYVARGQRYMLCVESEGDMFRWWFSHHTEGLLVTCHRYVTTAREAQKRCELVFRKVCREVEA